MGVINMTGMRCGNLTVISRADNAASGSAWWNVRCDCGKETTARGSDLRLGRKKSCGCMQSHKKSYSVPKSCEYCGNPVMREDYRFCSPSCSARARFGLPKIEVDESFQWKKTAGNRWKCRFGYQNISCTDRNCAQCGWNPEVAKKRSDEVRKKMEVQM